MTKFMDNQKTHVEELEFFEIFLPYSFRLIGPQTKQGNMHPWSAKIGLKFGFRPVAKFIHPVAEFIDPVRKLKPALKWG